MLLGGDAGHGLEPVGEVRYALLRCPILHGVGNNRSNLRIKMTTLINGLLQGLVGILGQMLLHYSIIKYVAAKDLIHMCHPGKPPSTMFLWFRSHFMTDCHEKRTVREKIPQRPCCMHTSIAMPRRFVKDKSKEKTKQKQHVKFTEITNRG